MITPGELHEIERLLQWRLAPWQHHPDWDDMTQCGRIAAWRALDGHRARGALTTLATRAIDWALRDWLRGRQCHANCRPRPGHPERPDRVSLDEAVEIPAPGDFAAALIDRVAIRSVWPGLRPIQREAMDLYYGEGLLMQEVARQLGKTESAVSANIRRGLAYLREQLAEPAAGPRPL